MVYDRSNPFHITGTRGGLDDPFDDSSLL